MTGAVGEVYSVSMRIILDSDGLRRKSVISVRVVRSTMISVESRRVGEGSDLKIGSKGEEVSRRNASSTSISIWSPLR